MNKLNLVMIVLLSLILVACQKKALPLAETGEPLEKPAYNQQVNHNK